MPPYTIQTRDIIKSSTLLTLFSSFCLIRRRLSRFFDGVVVWFYWEKKLCLFYFYFLYSANSDKKIEKLIYIKLLLLSAQFSQKLQIKYIKKVCTLCFVFFNFFHVYL